MLLSNNSFCTSSRDARRRWDALRCYSLELVGVVQTYQDLWSMFDHLASVRGSLQGLLTQEAWLRFILVNSNLLKSISINSANSSLNNQFLDLYSRMTDGFQTGLMFPADEDRDSSYSHKIHWANARILESKNLKTSRWVFTWSHQELSTEIIFKHLRSSDKFGSYLHRWRERLWQIIIIIILKLTIIELAQGDGERFDIRMIRMS